MTKSVRGERGRPRSGTTRRPDLSPAEQILDAAAQLFAQGGYAATSTRAIADEVGIRQASLYYYFASKEALLEQLLMRTVEPSSRVADLLESGEAPPAARLLALIRFDAGQLCAAPHNVGALYFLPEVGNPGLEPFRRERARLRGVYASLILQSEHRDPQPEGDAHGAVVDYRVDVIFGMVESVIAVRAYRAEIDAELLVEAVAQSCLRVLGHDAGSLAALDVEARTLTARG